jgi:SNF2 family DNA or RNA helicase
MDPDGTVEMTENFGSNFTISIKAPRRQLFEPKSGKYVGIESVLIRNPDHTAILVKRTGKGRRQITAKASELLSTFTGKLLPLDDVTFANLLRKRSRGAPRIRHPKHWRLCFQLDEPSPSKAVSQRGSPRESWRVRQFLQAADDPSLLLDPETLWHPRKHTPKMMKRISSHEIKEYLERARELAVTLFPPLGGRRNLDRENAIRFIAEAAPQLEQVGFTVRLPAWCITQKKTNSVLTIRRIIRNPTGIGTGRLTLNSLFDFDWKVALGDDSLTERDLRDIAALKVPIVRLRGRWVQFSEIDMQTIREYLAGKWKQQCNLQELIKVTLGWPESRPGVTVSIRLPEPVSRLVDELSGKAAYEELEAPPGLCGQLRPYQRRGFSWLAFLGKLGFGACLADDMGLGKTVQTLALLLRNWETEKRPTLLICPVSVIPNWEKEVARFAPSLPFMRHHSGDRLVNAAEFADAARRRALVFSSYNLLARDAELFQPISWAGIILDEAQNIKNHHTQQSRAARSLTAGFRIALTGTPIENHVGDLWSIMDFLNPGFLGTRSEFERRFLVPIHKHGDVRAQELLKRMTTPFVLRRMKTDKTIAPDLPEKMEWTVFCNLTREQATLYEAALQDAMKDIERRAGIERKGLVLTLLTKLKQICNHPAHFLRDNSLIIGRSGKLSRLTEMLEEVLQSNERALVFTQYKAMGDIIDRHLRATFGVETPFLHGGISLKQRSQTVERFEKDMDGPPVFILTHKVGGTGLNLTRATHVFHFDRWWNPAVERQATDRAHRIGQTRIVQIHKLICAGTLEEQLDAMLENKSAVASRIISSGESSLTELSTTELREILSLRNPAGAE